MGSTHHRSRRRAAGPNGAVAGLDFLPVDFRDTCRHKSWRRTRELAEIGCRHVFSQPAVGRGYSAVAEVRSVLAIRAPAPRVGRTDDEFGVPGARLDAAVALVLLYYDSTGQIQPAGARAERLGSKNGWKELSRR